MKASPLSNILSEFARGLLDEAGLSSIAWRVSSGMPLRFAEIEQLAKLPLPLLNILCLLQRSRSGASKTLGNSPVILIPRALANELPRQNQAVHEVLSYLQNLKTPPGNIRITFESWKRNDSSLQFLEFLTALSSEPTLDHLRFLGPPSDTLEQEFCPDDIETALFFQRLKPLGDTRIRIKFSSPLLSSCIDYGFEVAVTHSISVCDDSPLQLDVVNTARELQELSTQFTKLEHWYSWEPIPLPSLSDFSINAPLRLELLRLAAVTCLLLPPRVKLSLSAEYLGRSLHSLSTRFGASSSRPVCLNREEFSDSELEKLGLLGDADLHRANSQEEESEHLEFRQVNE